MPEGPRNIRLQYAFSSLEEVESSGFRPDLVIVCVKAYSLPEVHSEILNSGSLEGCLKDSDFLLLMNGLGNGALIGLQLSRELEVTVERVIDECLQVAALEGVALDRKISQDFVRSIMAMW